MNPDEIRDAAVNDVRNWPEFQRELSALINKHSMERPSNVPDYVLAEYLTQCLVAFNIATLTTREKHSNVVNLKTVG